MNKEVVQRLLDGIETAWGSNFAPDIHETSGTSIDEETIEVSSPECLEAKPLVTVYMLAYNHGKYIRQAIESVMNQKTNFPFELIIGEDCSPDNTREICLELQKRFPKIIRVLYSKVNLGVRKNSRRMRKRVRGDYVAFCEGDDFWTSPCKLQKQIDLMRNDPTTAICYTDFSVFNEQTVIQEHNMLAKSGVFDKWSQLTREDFISELFLGYNFFATASIVVNRKRWEEYLDENPTAHRTFLLGDIVLRTEMAKRGSVQCVHEDMVTYRLNSTGITQATGVLGAKFHLHNLYLKIYCISEVSDELFWKTIDFTVKSGTYYFTENTERRDAWRKSLGVLAKNCPFKLICLRFFILFLICLLPPKMSYFAFRVFRRLW